MSITSRSMRTVQMLRAATDLIPEPGPRRRLAIATFVNAEGPGAPGPSLQSRSERRWIAPRDPPFASVLRFGHAGPLAQGYYSGLFEMSAGMVSVIGPVLLGAICLGWLMPGVLMMHAGFMNPVVVKRARSPALANIGQLS
jgi:hypothetical protein